jgi:hypothetical protein
MEHTCSVLILNRFQPMPGTFSMTASEDLGGISGSADWEEYDKPRSGPMVCNRTALAWNVPVVTLRQIGR